MIRKSFGYVVLAAAVASMVPACNTERSEPSAEVEQTGAMRLPLEATAPSGNVYRLRYSQFYMAGPQGGDAGMGGVIVQPPDDASSSFTTVLDSGQYSIELFPGWQLWRMGMVEEPVQAALLSPNPTFASVFPNSETVVTFRFQAGSDIVVFGPGELTVDIDVVEVNCNSNMDCGAGQYCQAGMCVGSACMGPWDCAPGLACVNGQCMPGPVCGNGMIDPGESCDDGNNLNGDGCNWNCVYESCGDGYLDPGEQCDDQNYVNGDGCSWTCTVEVCGNAILDPFEECDDGNLDDGDWCNSDCTKPSQSNQCGDGLVQPNEVCDDGNITSADGCSSDCTFVEPGFNCPVPGQACSQCGNGVLEAPEVCDDGNNVNGDGCAAHCFAIEPGFVCPDPGLPCSSM